MNNYTFSYKSKPEDYTPRAQAIGREMRAHQDLIAGAIIYSGIARVLSKMSSLCDPHSEIIEDPETMAQWVNLAPVVDAIAIVMHSAADLDIGVVFNPQYLNAKIEKWVENIQIDINLAMGWIILYGADAPSIRKNISTKNAKSIRDAVKASGDAAFISLIYRACVAWVKIVEKDLKPRYLKWKAGDVCINTFANALHGAFK